MPDPDYFTLAEFRELPDMGEARFTDARIEAVAASVVSTIERCVATSFVARTQTAILDGSGTTVLVLPHIRVLDVTSVDYDGTAQSVSDFRVTPNGLLRCPSTSWFPSGTQNITVGYTSGYSATPPADIKEAAMQATRARVLETNSASILNARRSSVTDATGGTTTFILPTTDERPFGYPVVDDVVAGWRRELRQPWGV